MDLVEKYLCEKNSPLGKAIDHAKQWRITGDKKWIDKIRKTLYFYPPKELDDWIKQHTIDYGKKK